MALDDQPHCARSSAGTLTYAWPSPPPDVSTRCTRSGAWLVVEVAGELDLQAVPLLDTLGIDPCFVVLDLHGVTFMDCSGVRALLEARRRAVAAGGALHLASPSEHVVSLIRLTRLGRALPVFDSVSEAIAMPQGVAGAERSPGRVPPRWSRSNWPRPA